jgi:nitrite reductase/ring-hydroxylating ferredoxin subunit/DMSO/TMAO reductase YedYZ heme-binding membrane subunit
VSHAYVAVQWNRQKRLYDASLAAGLALYLTLFVGLGALANPGATAETLVIRGLGTAALLLLHVILCIGPLCRLSPALLPLLYNRRHLGVTMFALALAHAGFAAFQFHALGDVNPLVSVLTANTRFASVSQFPFEAFGLVALAILFVMAATSHDFWLANLTAPVWKTLHMGVYLAYAALVLHVALGVLQDEASPLLAGLLVAGFATVLGLHLAAAQRELPLDRERRAADDGWVDVCALGEIPEKRARIATVAGERVAVFRYDGLLSAVSNVCQHQNGPLGEGRVVKGCITCPWHGYQYDPATGASPAPFTERVPTFNVRVVSGRVEVHRTPNRPGTRVAPVRVGDPVDQPG